MWTKQGAMLRYQGLRFFPSITMDFIWIYNCKIKNLFYFKLLKITERKLVPIKIKIEESNTNSNISICYEHISHLYKQ